MRISRVSERSVLPSDLSGQANKLLEVNSAANGIQFVAPVLLPSAALTSILTLGAAGTIAALDPTAASVGNVPIVFDSGGGVLRVHWAAVAAGATPAGGAGQLQATDGAGNLTAPTNVLATANRITIGATPATTDGNIGLPASGSIASRNAGGTADLTWAQLSGSNQLVLGSDAAFTSAKKVASVRIASLLEMVPGGSFCGQWDSAGLQNNGPTQLAGTLGGLSGTPLHVANSAISFVGSDVTLSAAQAACPGLVCSASAGNILAPNTPGAIFIIDNTASVSARVIKKSGGTGAAIAASKVSKVWHNGTDYALLSVQ